MKKIICQAIALSFTVICHCQQITLLDKIPMDSLRLEVRYDTVFPIAGSQMDLLAKAKLWMVDAFKDSKSVIQSEDQLNGSIIGKGTFTYTTTSYQAKKGKIKSLGTYNSRAKFTIKIFTKQDKVKLVISDIKMLSELSTIEMDFDAGIISMARDKESKDLDQQASGLTAFEECSKIHLQLDSLIGLFIKYMGSKAETDF